MPGRDGKCPRCEDEGTGKCQGPCVTEKQLPREDKDPKGTTEKQLDETRGNGLGPCGDGKPRGDCGGKGKGGARGRRKGPNGITYF